MGEAIWAQFGMRVDFGSLPENRQTSEGILELVHDEAKKRYVEKKQGVPDEVLRHFERTVMLLAVDNQWKDHLLSMDHLKEGIGLRGYGQRDPLKEYQREGYDLFLDMSLRIKEETVRYLFLVQIATEEVMEELSQQREQQMIASHGDTPTGGDGPQPFRRADQKIGRNAPCPCGSGKKYKKCCGKAA